jgi:DNA-binding Lrp family transcriptional regulator
MDELDRKILNLIQTDFPLVPEPFAQVAEAVGSTEAEVLARVRALKEKGIIRRLGAVFDKERLGFASVLCAARVPEERLREFVATVNACPGVTHNYRRDHDYNVWFTFIAPSEEALARALDAIEEKTGVEILRLKATKTFKINARFAL